MVLHVGVSQLASSTPPSVGLGLPASLVPGVALTSGLQLASLHSILPWCWQGDLATGP